MTGYGQLSSKYTLNHNIFRAVKRLRNICNVFVFSSPLDDRLKHTLDRCRVVDAPSRLPSRRFAMMNLSHYLLNAPTAPDRTGPAAK